MSRKVVFQIEADFVKVTELLEQGLHAFEVHFGKEYPGAAMGMKKFSEYLAAYAKRNNFTFRLTVYHPDGSSTAMAVIGGALLGTIIEGVMIGRWFGPWGIAIGATIGGLGYLLSSRAVDIEIKAYLPDLRSGPIPA